MSENFNDYGDYSEELVYQSKSKLGKFFSFRTLKKILKFLAFAIILLVYGLLFFRLCSGGPPKALSKMLWTEDTLAAYAALGDGMTVYSQEPIEHVASDGYFGVYDILYVPEAHELQLTVRYNNSSVEKLRSELEEKERQARASVIRERIRSENEDISYAALESKVSAELEASLIEDPITIELSDVPFVFILRDNTGKVYTSYSYLSGHKTVYQYLRIAFSDVDLFGDAPQTPEHLYPPPQAARPEYFYTGANKAETRAITHLYLDMYYENDADVNSETFAYPLLVYRSTAKLERYDYAKQTPTEMALTHVDVRDKND